jgi:hypothetical protein
MKRHVAFAMFFCITVHLATVGWADETACKNLTYESRNQTDYGPLVVTVVRGTVQDAEGGPIPKACVGVFTEADHKLVAFTGTDDRGKFELNGLHDGEYRLVAKYEGFCPANAKLRIERRAKIKKPLTTSIRYNCRCRGPRTASARSLFGLRGRRGRARRIIKLAWNLDTSKARVPLQSKGRFFGTSRPLFLSGFLSGLSGVRKNT